MPRSIEHPRAGWRTLAAYTAVLLAGMAAVFALPWLVPPGRAIVSDSFEVGFSNRTAWLATIATATALAALGLRAGRPAVRPFAGARPLPQERTPRALVLALLLATLATGALFAWMTYNSFIYGEKSYFLDRMAYVINGNVPFVDLEFTYGPLLIWVPAGIQRLLAPLGATPQLAYALTWLALYVTGVWLLVYCVDRTQVDRAGRGWLLAAVGAYVWFNETVGINSLLVRFLTPVACLLFLHRRVSSETDEGALGGVRIAAWGLGTVALTFGLSPDLGIAYLAAITAYLGWLAWFRPSARFRLGLATLGVALAVMLVLVALVSPLASSGSQLSAMASGAINIPVLPAPPTLALLACVLAAAALLPRALRARDADGAAAVGMAVLTAVMLLGALGRADSGHLFFYGLPALFLAAGLARQVAPRAAAAGLLAFALVFGAAHLASAYFFYDEQIASAAIGTGKLSVVNSGKVVAFFGHEPGPARILRMRLLDALKPYDVSKLERYAPVAAPGGFRDTIAFRLAERHWLASSYYRGTPGTVEQFALERTYLEKADAVIVPGGYAEALYATQTPSPVPEDTRVGQDYIGLLMWPGTLPRRNEPPDIDRMLADYLRGSFRPADSVGPYAVLERKR